MILAAHQPAYNPWLGLIHKILLSDIFVVMDDVQFEKNSFINRNKILQNGNEVMLTIPVKTKNYTSKRIKDIEVSDYFWKKKHLKSIKQSYKKSKYFAEVFEQINDIYELNSNYLVDYTQAYLEFLLKYLGIKTKVIYASELNIISRKLDYVIELCKKVGADVFIFGALGKEYADLNVLNNNGIKAYFQNYNHPKYPQLSNNFHPNLGIIDLLFNVNKELIIDIIFKNNISYQSLRGIYA